ncbi:type II toxin-antitoxin system VapB family antitoxin [uncultured Thiodictyon sp.]|uniref:type II toxin-antitoxin system VapB family antitoxin n=1 Tax=uncultured Thiodictyon sp. TaxID=1846217 RepID=UPI0025EEBDCA|nr:type II toxin-antitoxin system VapB family antitoxin [uncultured Thiodictyon sp.]
MNTQVVIDDQLMKEALRLTGLKSTEDVIEVALQELIEHRRTDALAKAFGQMPWEGDLDAMRTDR